jgi:Domain of unknown function (DUF4383)
MNAGRYFSLIIGIAFLGAGIFGFVPGMVTPPMAEGTPADGRLFGLFPINALHNLVHIAIGIWGILAYRGFDSARTFARGLAVIYGLFAVMGLIPGLNTTFGMVPLYGHDVWLHALTAIAAAYFGWFHKPAATRSGDAAAYAGRKPPHTP